MDKKYEPSRQRQDWDFRSLMAFKTELFGSGDVNLDHSGTVSNQDLSAGAFEIPNETVTAIGGRKRSAAEDSFSPRVNKKRKFKPPPNVHRNPEPSTSFPPVYPPSELDPSCGRTKSKAKPLSAIDEKDYHYRKNTSRDDQIYFDIVVKNLRGASYLTRPQRVEPTISSDAGSALVGDGAGHARKDEDESVYAVLVDKPPLGPFLCWICGHPENQRKILRALGHVREHFEHRPWECSQDHRDVQDDNGKPKRRRGKGKDGPW